MADSDLRSFHGIIGRSAAIRDLQRRIQLVARTDATVLIRVERGTGKELVAGALQQLSRRSGAPYVKINCAALPRDLLASELFGHERGAFTGALDRRPGLFAVAHGGTLFADEIGNLSLEGQAMSSGRSSRGKCGLSGRGPRCVSTAAWSRRPTEISNAQSAKASSCQTCTIG